MALKHRSRLSRLRSFFKFLFAARMSAVGIVILFLYTFLALAAPVVSPYSPQEGGPISGALAPPVWFSYLSEGSRLSQNLALNQNPRFIVDPLFPSQGW